MTWRHHHGTDRVSDRLTDRLTARAPGRVAR
jgi:hypothetical protein